ncbi:MAG TPA: lysylphosphatidylglycerol synthase transmembrane domain-containing protein [Steroidobacteraceae bacterium]|nr:lysylphosphatidylglycerol synthase transmembrane domain-containing protein [Steroidobacteraceae bacterium]
MSQIRRFAPHALVLAFAAWCVFALRGDLAQVSLAPALHSWDLIVAAVVLTLVSYTARVARWRFYLARLGHRLPGGFAALTFIAGFAYTLSPGKVGEMVRARYYLPLGVPLSRVAAAFFAERLLDLVAMAVLAALLFAGSAQYRAVAFIAGALVAAILVFVAVLPWQTLATRAESLTWVPRLMRSTLVSAARTLVETRPLLRLVPLLLGFSVALFAWGLEGLGFDVLAGILPALHLPVMTGVGIYAVAALVGGVSFLPGGLGSTEAVMTTLLVTHGCTIGEAVFVTLACRLVTLWLAVGLGWIAVFLLRNRPLAVASPWQ